jgi:hypothetical protein
MNDCCRAPCGAAARFKFGDSKFVEPKYCVGSHPTLGYKEQSEGVGFEPTVGVTPHNDFRDRPVQPLRHPSAP